jgi:hypothetical protein
MDSGSGNSEGIKKEQIIINNKYKSRGMDSGSGGPGGKKHK